MNIECTQEEGITLAILSGRLDSATSTSVLARLIESIDHPAPRLLLDASPLDYVSSAGLRTLLSVAKKIRATGGKIALAAMKSQVREIYEISGFQSIIPSYPDLASARAGLSG
jgi:anti-anti-sigma factor